MVEIAEITTTEPELSPEQKASEFLASLVRDESSDDTTDAGESQVVETEQQAKVPETVEKQPDSIESMRESLTKAGNKISALRRKYGDSESERAQLAKTKAELQEQLDALTDFDAFVSFLSKKKGTNPDHQWGELIDRLQVRGVKKSTAESEALRRVAELEARIEKERSAKEEAKKASESQQTEESNAKAREAWKSAVLTAARDKAESGMSRWPTVASTMNDRALALAALDLVESQFQADWQENQELDEEDRIEVKPLTIEQVLDRLEEEQRQLVPALPKGAPKPVLSTEKPKGQGKVAPKPVTNRDAASSSTQRNPRDMTPREREELAARRLAQVLAG
jgi:antitoxin component HigA of HigAB toxin-antitoxin module